MIDAVNLGLDGGSEEGRQWGVLLAGPFDQTHCVVVLTPDRKPFFECSTLSACV